MPGDRDVVVDDLECSRKDLRKFDRHGARRIGARHEELCIVEIKELDDEAFFISIVARAAKLKPSEFAFGDPSDVDIAGVVFRDREAYAIYKWPNADSDRYFDNDEVPYARPLLFSFRRFKGGWRLWNTLYAYRVPIAWHFHLSGDREVDGDDIPQPKETLGIAPDQR